MVSRAGKLWHRTATMAYLMRCETVRSVFCSKSLRQIWHTKGSRQARVRAWRRRLSRMPLELCLRIILTLCQDMCFWLSRLERVFEISALDLDLLVLDDDDMG